MYLQRDEHTRAERNVLGSLLMDNSAIDDIALIIPEDGFFDSKHNQIYRAIHQCKQKGVPADILTVATLLPDLYSYVADLTSDILSPANVEFHAKQVREDLDRRRAYCFGIELSEKAKGGEARDGLFDWAGRAWMEISENIGIHRSRPASDSILHAVEDIEQRYHDRKPYSGIPTGLTDLDDMLDGLHDEYIVVGARPSVGKTALALTIAANLSIRTKVKTAFFSLEMSEKLLTHRLLAMESRMDSMRLRRGLIGAMDFPKLTEAASMVNDAPLYFYDEPNANILNIKAEARNVKRKFGIQVIFIDYIGLITMNQNIPRHEEVSRISRELKSMSRELELPVIALSQVGRDADDKQPKLRDLRESGSIEQDADTVIFIHRDEGEPRSRKIIVAKQRNGPVGSFDLAYHPEYTRFDNYQKE